MTVAVYCRPLCQPIGLSGQLDMVDYSVFTWYVEKRPDAAAVFDAVELTLTSVLHSLLLLILSGSSGLDRCVT